MTGVIEANLRKACVVAVESMGDITAATTDVEIDGAAHDAAGAGLASQPLFEEVRAELLRMRDGVRAAVRDTVRAERNAAAWSAQPLNLLFEPGDVVFDEPATPPALWGTGAEVLATPGEPTVMYAGTGVGKTTIAQRLGLAAIGIGPAMLLGYDVARIDGRVLYIAADRPSQAIRSLRRMVTEADARVLRERWRWERHKRLRITPEHPTAMLEAARSVDAGLVIGDSIKDLVAKPATDESGQAYNDAVQHCSANGIAVLGLHHPRKAIGAEKRTKLDLDDVYGSTWLTAGAGSVIALLGEPGTGVAQLRHLKTPADEVGPFDVTFDYATGEVRTIGRRDLIDLLKHRGEVTTAEAVQFVTGKPDYTDAERLKVLRKLKKLAVDGTVDKNDQGKGRPTRWRYIAPQLILRNNHQPGHRKGDGQGDGPPPRPKVTERVTQGDGHNNTQAEPVAAQGIRKVTVEVTGDDDTTGRERVTVSPPLNRGETSPSPVEAEEPAADHHPSADPDDTNPADAEVEAILDRRRDTLPAPY